jgi:nucleoid-associated protein YgaU
MGGMFRGLRFVVGVALVTAGTAVAAPRIREFLDRQPPMLAMTGGNAAAAPPTVANHAIPDPQGPVDVPAPPPPPAPAEVAPVLPPPTPLPQAAAGAWPGPPPLDLAYRSTLALPPPPLLDAAPPPPGSALMPVAGAGGPAPPAAREWPAAVSSDVIRDGDDLTTIALRVYGHPGAAAAILAVNRDRITDPALLPVGVPLRVPPSWNPQGEAVAAAPVIAPPQRPARVVVGPGESFESLAGRFYGDPRYAGMLFEANRDVVRSPALLTQGTELRLP